MFSKRKLKLKKRPCDIKMKLVPYGGGWTDVHLDICGDHLYFIISGMQGDQFEELLRSLYYLHPKSDHHEDVTNLIDTKVGIMDLTPSGYKVIEIVDDISCNDNPLAYCDIPWKASFEWDGEITHSSWTLQRIPDLDTDFILTIDIRHIHEDGSNHLYHYEVPYKDFCYAAAKACTEMLKEYGFYGYHCSTYVQYMNVRYLLFIKSIALDNFEVRELTHYKERGHGETSNFDKELELLLFDM